MNETNYVVILIAKCSVSHKTYGMRVEKSASQWIVTWAFPIKESSAKREGYDKTSIKGDIQFSDNYPGCPYCKGNAVTLCKCGHLSCTDPKTETFICEWCGAKGKLGAYTGEAITAGMDA